MELVIKLPLFEKIPFFYKCRESIKEDKDQVSVVEKV